MACCNFKPPWFTTTSSSTNSHHHHRLILQQQQQQNRRNSQIQNKKKYLYNGGCLSFPSPTLKRFDLYKLSCSTTTTRRVGVSSSNTNNKEGLLISSSINNLSPLSPSSYLVDSTTTTTTDDDDDDDDDDNDSEVICGSNEAAPLPPDSSAAAAAAAILSIVQVNCEYEAPDLALPWLTIKGFRRNNNGFIIDDGRRRLLTCAHCIEHHTNVTIRKLGSNTVYQATVISISHDFDLAMLTISDDEFWQGVGAVEFGDMPSPRDELTNMSYLQFTATITSISGFISHMGMIPYSHGGLKLPGFEVSYASDIAKSGSGVFNLNGKCVGMAFHQNLESNNPGRVIPVTIIKHFLQDYDRNGGCTGLPIFGITWQKMENHDLRMYERMQHDQEGVQIVGMACHTPELHVLDPYDVILSIDGVKIANDGTVPFVRGQRIDFNYLFTQKYTGDTVLVKVLRNLRNSKIHEFSIKLATHKQFVRGDIKGRPQKYYIIGGLVFTTLTTRYIQSLYTWAQHGKWGRSLMDEELSNALYKECVVVSQVLEAEVNKGYASDITNMQVKYVNGKHVKDMKRLVSLVESYRKDYLEFVLQGLEAKPLLFRPSRPGCNKGFLILLRRRWTSKQSFKQERRLGREFCAPNGVRSSSSRIHPAGSRDGSQEKPCGSESVGGRCGCY